MKKSLFASEKVMADYLEDLLTEEEDNASPEPVLAEKSQSDLSQLQKKPLESLLKKVSEVEKVAPISPAPILTTAKATDKPLVGAEPKPRKTVTFKTRQEKQQEQQAFAQATVAEAALDSAAKQSTKDKEFRQGSFQALIFEVAGLTVAVPLKNLGGIHEMGSITKLMGKPDWYMGLMTSREQKMNVVNTAKWVMPEKYDIKLEQSINYQYLIMLDNSGWGLACESLINTITLEHDDVKWREVTGRRPWLAGMVKEKMCALFDVDELILLLEKGLNASE